MKKIIVLSALVLILSNINSVGQVRYKNSPYFSALLGNFKSAGGNGYDRSSSLSFGAGFGIPIFGNLSLYTKLSYYSKSDFSAFEDQNLISSGLNVDNELVRVNASFSQFIFNGGLQYTIPIYQDLFVAVNGGITYSLVNQEITSFGGSPILNLDNRSVYGYFGGISAEKDFSDSDLSMLVEVQYLYFNDDVVRFHRALSGLNLAIGMRYYFTR